MDWRFILCNAKDMSNIGELTQARERKVSQVLNQSGTASFSYPMNGELASYINPYTTAVKLYRNKVLIWSGYVLNIDEDISGYKMTVNCVGWLNRLEKRVLRRRIYHVALTDDAAIIYDLLGEANGVYGALSDVTTGGVPYEHTAGISSAAGRILYEDCSGPDGSMPSGWDSIAVPTHASMKRLSNQFASAGADNVAATAIYNDSNSAINLMLNAEISYKVTALGSGAVYLYLRSTNPGTASVSQYLLAIPTTGTTWTLYRTVNNSAVSISTPTASRALQANDVLAFRVVQNSTGTQAILTGTLNGTQVLNYTDTAANAILNAGYAGLGCSYTATRIDDVRIRNDPAGYVQYWAPSSSPNLPTWIKQGSTQSSTEIVSSNTVLNPGAETNVTDIVVSGTGVTLSRDTSMYHSGTAAAKTVTAGAVGDAVRHKGGTVSNRNTLYFEVWARASAGSIPVELRAREGDTGADGNLAEQAIASATLDTSWQKLSGYYVVGTASGSPGTDVIASLKVRLNSTVSPAPTIWTDDAIITNLSPVTKAYTQNKITSKYEVGQNILSAINDISARENGPDIRVDPATRVLNIWRKRTVVRPGVVFGYHAGPKNVQQFGRQIDGSTQINYLKVVGTQAMTPHFKDATDQQQLYGMLEEELSLSDAPDENYLQAIANAEVAMRATAHITYSLTPFPYSTASASVPNPFVDYNVGDYVRLVAKYPPRIDINQWVRVFGISANIDEEGNEKLDALQLAPG